MLVNWVGPALALAMRAAPIMRLATTFFSAACAPKRSHTRSPSLLELPLKVKRDNAHRSSFYAPPFPTLQEGTASAEATRLRPSAGVCRVVGTNTQRSEKIVVPNNLCRYAPTHKYFRIAEPHSPRRACGKNRLPLPVCGRSQASSPLRKLRQPFR